MPPEVLFASRKINTSGNKRKIQNLWQTGYLLARACSEHDGGGGGVIGKELKREGAKYRNYITSIFSSPFPNMLQERRQLQGLKHGLQG